jgi:hypothetical protein
MCALIKCRAYHIVLFCFSLLSALSLHAQLPDSTRPKIPVDSLPAVAAPVNHPSKIDSVLKNHSPRIAAIRSAILPGLGQAYNKKYWKIPIVYGALGVSGAVFVYNLKNYRDLRFAYQARFKAIPRVDANGNSIPGDSSDLPRVKPLLRDIDLNALKGYRDEFRRNIDYSALVFIALWGLNVVDAVVDAHLKSFDVSPDLSFHFKVGHSEMAGTNGLSLVLSIK